MMKRLSNLKIGALLSIAVLPLGCSETTRLQVDASSGVDAADAVAEDLALDLTPSDVVALDVSTAWGASYSAECVQSVELQSFVDLYYRRAPEDFANEGAYTRAWIGR